MPEILICGAEGEQFLFENELTTFGQDDKRRGSVSLLSGDQMFRQFSTGYADFWVHFRVAPFDVMLNNGTTFGGTLMRILGEGTTLVRITSIAEPENSNLDSSIEFRYDVATNGSGTMDTGPLVPHGVQVFINYDIRVRVTTVSVVNDTLTVDFYRNEVLRRSVTYTDAAGFSLPDAVEFNPRVNNTPQDDTRYQDIIVTDALPTVGMELATLVPAAVGTYSDFTNDYTAIDDLGYSQSSVISSTTVGDRESWFFSDPEFNIGDKVIYGVAITTVAQTDLSGLVDDFQPFVRIGGVDYAAAALGANNVAPNAYTVVLTDNPSTTNPWTQVELLGLESGIQSI